MKNLLLPSLAVVAASVAFAGMAQGQAADLAGVWTHSGTQTELVVQPRVRLQPYATPGYGTSYGGSAGYGSMTTTNVMTEPTPVQVRRTMTLTIPVNGAAVWRIEKRQSSGPNCTQTIRQVKNGRVATRGDQLTFQITDGTERTESTCAAATSRTLPPGTETYGLTRRGNSLSLTSGGSTWTFSRG